MHVFGLEGEIAGTGNNHCQTIFFTGGAQSQVCRNPGRDRYAGARVGTAIGRSTLLYAKGGYTNVGVSYASPDPVTPTITDVGDGEVSGVRLGAGIEQRLSERLSLKAEYRYSNYDSFTIRHQAVLGLGLHF